MAEVKFPPGIARESKGSTEPIVSGFHITRLIDGIPVNLPLTPQELYEAFSYQEQQHYVANVELYLGHLELEGQLGGHTADEIIGNEELLANIVLSYTRNRNGYNMESDAAAKDAISEEISKADATGFSSTLESL